MITRQRVVGRTNGSSTYLLSLVEAMRARGMSVDLICPSPATLGRWPVLRPLPEMAAFGAVRMRGARRLGGWFLARDPQVWGAAGLAVADRLLRRTRLGALPARWVVAAPYAVAVPWTEADLCFVSKHAGSADVVLADYAFSTPALSRAGRPGARTAVVMHDMFSARPAQFARLGVGGDSVAAIDEAEEMAMLGAADGVIAIQAAEAAAVRAALPHSAVFCAPMATPTVSAPYPGEDDLLLFVGSNTAPNNDGLGWFLEQSWPTIRAARPAARLLVAGSVAAGVAARPEGVTFLGRVGDLDPLYDRAGLVVSPLRAGSGLKIKLVEAMGRGKAIVASPVTLQGVEAETAGAVARAEADSGFAATVSALSGDPAAREALAERALQAARAHFSAEACYGPLLDWLEGRARTI